MLRYSLLSSLRSALRLQVIKAILRSNLICRCVILAAISLALPIDAQAQQVINYTINSANFTALIREGLLIPNQTFYPNSFNSTAIGQSISTGASSVALGASPSAFYDLATHDLSYSIGAVATGSRSIAIGSGQGGNATVFDTYCVGGCPGQFLNGTGTVNLGATAADSIAIGTAASASQSNAIAIGNGAIAGYANTIALGSNSFADPPHVGPYTVNGGIIAATGSLGGTLSIGNFNGERQIQNVGAGAVNPLSTDAINGSQLYAVGSAVNTNTANIATNTSSINTLNTTVASQGTQINTNTANIATNTSSINTLNTTVASQGTQISTNTANIATNTSSINTLNTTVASQGTQISTNTANIATTAANLTTAGGTTAAALGGGSTYTAGGGVTAPNYNINGRTYNDVGSALTAVNGGYSSLSNNINALGQATMSGFTNAYGMINNNQKEARQGIAMAAALAQAPMPSAPGKTSWKFNNAVYKNAAATSLSIAHRLPTRVPVAVTAGVAIGLRNTAIVSGGLQGEF